MSYSLVLGFYSKQLISFRIISNIYNVLLVPPGLWRSCLFQAGERFWSGRCVCDEKLETLRGTCTAQFSPGWRGTHTQTCIYTLCHTYVHTGCFRWLKQEASVRQKYRGWIPVQQLDTPRCEPLFSKANRLQRVLIYGNRLNAELQREEGPRAFTNTNNGLCFFLPSRQRYNTSLKGTAEVTVQGKQ